MTLLQTASILVALAGIASYANYRFIGLPSAIGLMVIALGGSLVALATIPLGVDVHSFAQRTVGRVDFGEALLSGMLGFLLFAGAINVDISELARERWPVAFLALLGVAVSTALVGFGSRWILGLLGIDVPLAWCLVFGALISPTDPVSVLAIIRSIGAPKSLEMKIAGESLFNDGVGVVVFLQLLGYAAGEHALGAKEVATFFVREAAGGAAFGLVLGYVVYKLLGTVDDYEVEVLLTVGLVMGGYAAAEALGLSAPIAIVCAGLLLGNRGRRYAMSKRTQQHLDVFWNLIDSMLNAILFLLIGLEVLLLPLETVRFEIVLIAIPIVLAARLASVALARAIPCMRSFFPWKDVVILWWGGLRGGISVALALAIPAGEARNTILLATYGVVLFAVLVQGTTVGALTRRLTR